MRSPVFCLECERRISPNELKFSITNFNIPLCREHQEWVESIDEKITDETLSLYFALKERGVPAELEKFDGFKHIDIAIPEARINIEVDGAHHNTNYRQALADLKRTYYSFLKGYYTIRIPNSLVYNDSVLNETADFLVDILNESMNRRYGLGR